MTDKQTALLDRFGKLCAYLDQKSEIVKTEYKGKAYYIDSLIAGDSKKIKAWFDIMDGLNAEANADSEFAEVLLNYEYRRENQ